MSLDGCYEREAAILDEQLSSGTITITEYNEYMEDLDREMREYHSC